MLQNLNVEFGFLSPVGPRLVGYFTFLITAVITIFNLGTAYAACPDSPCYFSAHENQRLILTEARFRAARARKVMLIVYGYDACPWSRAVLDLLRVDPRAAGLRAEVEVVPILASRENPSGRVVMAELSAKFGAAAGAGVPQLVLVDPTLRRGRWVDALEYESKISPAGYEAEPLVEALVRTARSLR